MNTIENDSVCFPAMKIPFVSIIIPVLNNADEVVEVLNALQSQTYPRTRYEIIVIDNYSRNETIKNVLKQ